MNPTITSESTPAPRTAPFRRTRPGRIVIAVAASAAVSLLVHQLGVALAGEQPQVQAADGTTAGIGAGAVLLAAALAALAGAMLMKAFERWVPRPHGTWLVVALVVLLLSLTGPMTQATSGAGLLVALHVTVAAVLVVALLLPGRRRPVA